MVREVGGYDAPERAEISFQRTVRVSVSEQDLSAEYGRKSLIDRPHTISETKDWSAPRGKQHHDPRRARSASCSVMPNIN
jgi:hypothetical protein